MTEASLRLTGIAKSYPGVRALDGVSFECLAGEVHAVLGENGSGKSTLLGIAAGARAPDAGTVEIMGQPLTAADPQLARRLGLATVYQDDSLVRELTVGQNLYLGGARRDTPYAGHRQWAAGLLAQYDFGLTPDALVSDLSPSQCQFLEIVKALSSDPKVLLLDEPTSTLDLEGVQKLSALVRTLAAKGTAIVYVSHRLPEILELADRVTILRDGIGRGTYTIDDTVSEKALIALMVGRNIESEYPDKGQASVDHNALSVTGLTGPGFRDVSFHVARGEIVGLAGAEGNGQRGVIRALSGLVDGIAGTVTVNGDPVRLGSPRQAMAGGLLFLSADRAGESIFPELGVRDNITLQVLDRYTSAGMVSARRETEDARSLVAQYNIMTPTVEAAINGLSGGNQQKSVLARSFHFGAPVVLIDEPTQGVDAAARFEIYEAIRRKVAAGATVVVNSSDALELAGICDRVITFSRGRIVAELRGEAVNEEGIVSSFLRSTNSATAGGPAETPPSPVARFFRTLAAGGSQWWIPPLFLLGMTLLVGLYATIRSDNFLTQLNIRHILLANAPLTLVAMAQFNVLLVRGFDISVGSLMSVTVVLASFILGASVEPNLFVFGVLGCLLVGVIVGSINGAMVRFAGVNAVITTIASLSILQGIALLLRPTPKGPIHTDFVGVLTARIDFIPASFFVILVAAVLGDFWLHRTASGLKVRAVGFREEAAKRNGVRVDFVHLRAYILSSVIAVCAGLFLSSEVGVGTPVIGATYTLTSIAAAVLGGAALSGGRGSFTGTLLGALFFTLTVNVISLLGMNTSVGIIASGALTLLAVFLYSGLRPARRLYQKAIHAIRHRRTAARLPT